MTTDITFEGLERLEERIRRLNRDADHMIMWERTDYKKKEENLGRFDFSAMGAAPYLMKDLDPALQEYRSPTDGEEEESELSRAVERPEFREPPFTEVLEAGCRWLRDEATRNTIGHSFRRFRVKIYGPKGVDDISSGTFLAHNPSWQEPVTEESLPLTAMPAPTFDESALEGAARSVKVLGDLYSQWGHLVLGAVSQIQGVNGGMIAQLNRELTDSRQQIERLVASILEFRVSQLASADQRDVQTHQDEFRAGVVRDALQQLGDAARVFLSAKGLSPELAEVGTILGSNPELMATLKDPDVRALLSNPAYVSMLAGMLRQLGQQARAQAGPPPPSSPTPTPQQAAA